MKERFTPLRLTIAFATIVVLLLAWRFWSPWDASHLLDMIGRDALEVWTRPYIQIGQLGVTPALLVKLLVF